MQTDADTPRRNTALLDWYASEARALPWRTVPDPYTTLVSEVMLQQTQVDRVIPRFNQFIERWPTVEALASADRGDVIAEWSGLGYNSRAVRLHDAAKHIARAGWPTSVRGLRDLPGVGSYTAAAIASIAFDEPVPAVDTNLRRVIGRWVGEPVSGAQLSTIAEELLGEPAGAWNQAIMDLGATICRPRDPGCDACPVEPWCSDPAVYEAPPRQTAFDGSRRQLRGALVRAAVNGDDPHEAGADLGWSRQDIDTTLEQLRDEGLVG